MSATAIAEYRTPPRLDAGNKKVLGEDLGYPVEYVEKLKEEGIL